MTTDELRHLATVALDDIRKQKPSAVYAGRQGITAGMRRPTKQDVIFRRENGRVQMELWNAIIEKAVFPLPLDLEEEAAKVLDAM